MNNKIEKVNTNGKYRHNANKGFIAKDSKKNIVPHDGLLLC